MSTKKCDEDIKSRKKVEDVQKVSVVSLTRCRGCFRCGHGNNKGIVKGRHLSCSKTRGCRDCIGGKCRDTMRRQVDEAHAGSRIGKDTGYHPKCHCSYCVVVTNEFGGDENKLSDHRCLVRALHRCFKEEKSHFGGESEHGFESDSGSDLGSLSRRGSSSNNSSGGASSEEGSSPDDEGRQERFNSTMSCKNKPSTAFQKRLLATIQGYRRPAQVLMAAHSLDSFEGTADDGDNGPFEEGGEEENPIGALRWRLTVPDDSMLFSAPSSSSLSPCSNEFLMTEARINSDDSDSDSDEITAGAHLEVAEGDMIAREIAPKQSPIPWIVAPLLHRLAFMLEGAVAAGTTVSSTTMGKKKIHPKGCVTGHDVPISVNSGTVATLERRIVPLLTEWSLRELNRRCPIEIRNSRDPTKVLDWAQRDALSGVGGARSNTSAEIGQQERKLGVIFVPVGVDKFEEAKKSTTDSVAKNNTPCITSFFQSSPRVQTTLSSSLPTPQQYGSESVTSSTSTNTISTQSTLVASVSDSNTFASLLTSHALCVWLCACSYSFPDSNGSVMAGEGCGYGTLLRTSVASDRRARTRALAIFGGFPRAQLRGHEKCGRAANARHLKVFGLPKDENVGKKQEARPQRQHGSGKNVKKLTRATKIGGVKGRNQGRGAAATCSSPVIWNLVSPEQSSPAFSILSPPPTSGLSQSSNRSEDVPMKKVNRKSKPRDAFAVSSAQKQETLDTFFAKKTSSSSSSSSSSLSSSMAEAETAVSTPTTSKSRRRVIFTAESDADKEDNASGGSDESDEECDNSGDTLALLTPPQAQIKPHRSKSKYSLGNDTEATEFSLFYSRVEKDIPPGHDNRHDTNHDEVSSGDAEGPLSNVEQELSTQTEDVAEEDDENEESNHQDNSISITCGVAAVEAIGTQIVKSSTINVGVGAAAEDSAESDDSEIIDLTSPSGALSLQPLEATDVFEIHDSSPEEICTGTVEHDAHDTAAEPNVLDSLQESRWVFLDVSSDEDDI